MTRAGPRPGPNYLGAPGRVAIVQGQVYIVGVMLVAQLLLITIGLFELLSGHGRILWWITAASFAFFVIALIVYFWPRRRVEGF
jgi:membrane protein implicated in regulation of membrane protease activity